MKISVHAEAKKKNPYGWSFSVDIIAMEGFINIGRTSQELSNNTDLSAFLSLPHGMRVNAMQTKLG